MTAVGWPQNAYVGQKVVRYREGKYNLCPTPPIGETVTISWIGISECSGEVAIDLVEYPAPAENNLERGYNINVFRPAQSTESGMKVLTAILKNVDIKEKA